MQEHANPPQPNFVMPPRRTHHAARRHSCIPLRPHTLSFRRNPPPSSYHQIPAVRPPILHMCQLRPSYDHSTNSTPPRYKLPFSRYEKCRNVECSPIWPYHASRPRFPSRITTKSATHASHPGIHPMQPIGQLWPSYDHETNETPPRYESNRYSYEERLTPYLAYYYSPPNSRPIRPNHHDERSPYPQRLSPQAILPHTLKKCPPDPASRTE